jgi:hypothetical protein
MPIRKPPYAKILEIASTIEPTQDGRIHIENVNGLMIFEHKATPAEYKAGLTLAISRSLLWLHESETYVKFTQAAPSCSPNQERSAQAAHCLRLPNFLGSTIPAHGSDDPPSGP